MQADFFRHQAGIWQAGERFEWDVGRSVVMCLAGLCCWLCDPVLISTKIMIFSFLPGFMSGWGC